MAKRYSEAEVKWAAALKETERFNAPESEEVYAALFGGMTTYMMRGKLGAAKPLLARLLPLARTPA